MANILITGANRGIGLELGRQLSARKERVIAACRRSSPELDALGVEVHTGVDVGELASVEALDAALGDSLGDEGLDWIINNAGILLRMRLDALDYDAIRQQLEINALGPLRVIATLRHRLRPGSKLAIVSSRMGSMGDNSSGSSYGYRMSKAAVNMAGVTLAHDLREAGVAVALLHPGWVRTDMTGGQGYIDAETSARGMIARIDELTLETSGGFWHQDGQRLPW